MVRTSDLNKKLTFISEASSTPAQEGMLSYAPYFAKETRSNWLFTNHDAVEFCDQQIHDLLVYLIEGDESRRERAIKNALTVLKKGTDADAYFHLLFLYQIDCCQPSNAIQMFPYGMDAMAITQDMARVAMQYWIKDADEEALIVYYKIIRTVYEKMA